MEKSNKQDNEQTQNKRRRPQSIETYAEKKIDIANRELSNNRIKKEAESKSKVNHWLDLQENRGPGTRPEYMNKLNRKQCNAILKTRSRMLPVKENHVGGNYQDNNCRFCKVSPETQKHIIEECTHIANPRGIAIEYSTIFQNNNVDNLKNQADRIIEIIQELEK